MNLSSQWLQVSERHYQNGKCAKRLNVLEHRLPIHQAVPCYCAKFVTRAQLRVEWATPTQPLHQVHPLPVKWGVREPRALPLAIRSAQFPQRRFNRRLVSGLGTGESRHSTPKSLFVRRTLCAERRLGMTCGR